MRRMTDIQTKIACAVIQGICSNPTFIDYPSECTLWGSSRLADFAVEVARFAAPAPWEVKETDDLRKTRRNDEYFARLEIMGEMQRKQNKTPVHPAL